MAGMITKKAKGHHEGVIAKPRVFSSGARDLPAECMFIRHRRLDRIGVKGKYATAKTILRIDHEQLSEVCCSLHRHHRRSVAACMAAQEQTPPWFHQPLQRNPTRVLRAIFLSGPAIAREKEIKGWRRSKKINLIESMNPRWDDLAEDWQKLYKPAPGSDRQEIPRPAGENAGLRDDAVDYKNSRLMLSADKTSRSR